MRTLNESEVAAVSGGASAVQIAAGLLSAPFLALYMQKQYDKPYFEVLGILIGGLFSNK